jgi:hypothetical protein
MRSLACRCSTRRTRVRRGTPTARLFTGAEEEAQADRLVAQAPKLGEGTFASRYRVRKRRGTSQPQSFNRKSDSTGIGIERSSTSVAANRLAVWIRVDQRLTGRGSRMSSRTACRSPPRHALRLDVAFPRRSQPRLPSLNRSRLPCPPFGRPSVGHAEPPKVRLAGNLKVQWPSARCSPAG